MEDRVQIAFVVIVTVILISGILYKQYGRNEMIAECEMNLPRTQTCELVAVPVRGTKSTGGE